MPKNINGFICPSFNKIIQLLYYTNVVELFKFSARYIMNLKLKGKATQNDLIFASNMGIDTYQIFKWGILMLLWVFGANGILSKYLIIYLIYSNLFVYFYYHVWGSKFKQRYDRDTLNRKFLNYLLAIVYYLFAYAYLYQYHYADQIQWPENLIDFKNAIYFSVANAFTLTYGDFQPLTQSIRTVLLTELLNTFLFFTIIISNSIPNHTNQESNK